MFKKTSLVFVFLYYLLTPVFGVNPTYINPPSVMQYKSSGYDPFNTQILGNGYSVSLQNTLNTTQVYSFTMSRGLYYNTTEALAFPYGRAAKNTTSGDYLAYHLQRSAGSVLRDDFIYKELQDSPTYENAGSGVIQPNKTLSTYAAVAVPPGQVVPPGTYEDNVEALVYNTSLNAQNPNLVQRVPITVRIYVPEFMSIDLESQDKSRLYTSVDFDELKSGEERSFYLNLQTNSSTLSVRFQSDNLGKLVSTTDPSQTISYSAYFGSSLMRLTTPNGYALSIGSSLFLKRQLRFVVGTVGQNLTPGDYQDIIRVTFTTL